MVIPITESMELLNAKGTRDFPPQQKIVKNKVVDALKKVFELFGYSPLETPVLERYDLLAAKYAGGAEILKETFKLTDQGKRELCLRYDLTVPFSRFVGMDPTMKMPFKRYQIGPVFRDGPIKLGRYREFWQCDIDVVGTKNMLADAEIVQMTLNCFKEVGLDVIVEVNNRKILDGIMEVLGIPKNKWVDVILTVDKLKKIPLDNLKKELSEKGVDKKTSDKLLKIIQTSGANKDKIKKLRKILTTEIGIQGLDEIEECLTYVNNKNAVFEISLCRGLAYYTGTVFEAFMKDGSFSSSLAGGGRYDNMIGDFLGSGEYPAVGISFGLEPIIEVMKLKKKIDDKKTVTQVYVIPFGTAKQSMKIASQLRKAGIKTEVDLVGRNPSKNLKYANSLNILFVLFVGHDEIKKKKYKLKNMKTGKFIINTLDKLITLLKK
ncbi:histidine--tRNA ligase [Candidatus Woesearchaeota archaeon CG10_big_fil_rev_8_21_14_0_10_34_8]|nr:MAG: histidine--tRNA ligase [Candidatus Woesearchaeota archaeon CG10_big_fil_rev_8_21_14_0_10_34_8]